MAPHAAVQIHEATKENEQENEAVEDAACPPRGHAAGQLHPGFRGRYSRRPPRASPSVRFRALLLRDAWQNAVALKLGLEQDKLEQDKLKQEKENKLAIILMFEIWLQKFVCWSPRSRETLSGPLMCRE